jgi:hypothetical protein
MVWPRKAKRAARTWDPGDALNAVFTSNSHLKHTAEPSLSQAIRTWLLRLPAYLTLPVCAWFRRKQA